MFVALALEGRRQEMPCQRVPLYTFEAELLLDTCRVSASNSPTGMYCGGVDTKATKKPTIFS